jgi:hypothetical protein
MKRAAKAPTNPFSIPRFVSLGEVGLAAIEVSSVNADGTFEGRVYDPLGALTDYSHGDVVVKSTDNGWIAVELQPVLFKAA